MPETTGRFPFTAAPSRPAFSFLLFLAFAVSALAVPPARADGGPTGMTLRPIGYGGGGRYTTTAFDPENANIIYVGSDVAGFFKSVDGGESFTPLGADLKGLAVAAVAPSPDDPNTVALLCDQGLYLSRDKGNAFTELSDIITYGERFFGGRLLMFTKDGLLAATDLSGAYLVPLDGSPAPRDAMPGMEYVKVNSFARLGERVFAAADDGAFELVGGAWTPRNDGLGYRFDMVDMAAAEGAGLFAVERRDGLYAFDPETNVWRKTAEPPTALFDDPPRFKLTAVDPNTPGLVFLATDPEYWPHALFRSEDGGGSWEKVDDYELTDETDNWAKSLESPECLAFPPTPGPAFMTDWWHVWKSVDKGLSWKTVQSGLQNTVVNDIKTTPGNPSKIYLATSDNGLMVSPDNGATWKRKMAGVKAGHARAIEASQTHPGRLYLLMRPWESEDTAKLVRFHLYASDDDGDSWRELRVSIPRKDFFEGGVNGEAVDIEIDPADDNLVYLAVNGYGLFRIDAKGAQGDVPAVNIGESMLSPNFSGLGTLLVHPEKPGVIYASTNGGGVNVTRDGGTTWKQASPKYDLTFGLAMDPKNPDVLYVGLPEKQLLRSKDGGKTWKKTTLPGDRPDFIPVNCLAVDPDNPEIVYAGTSAYDYKAADGVYMSRDRGASFARVRDRLPRASVFSLATRARARNGCGLLVGYNGLGLYEGCGSGR